jgi:hypothetical protein
MEVEPTHSEDEIIRCVIKRLMSKCMIASPIRAARVRACPPRKECHRCCLGNSYTETMPVRISCFSEASKFFTHPVPLVETE